MDIKQLLAYTNRMVKKLSSQIALKADAGESVDLSNIYIKSEVDALISGIELLPGPQGAQGIQGIQGLQGNPGSDASVTKVNVEAVLTGEISSHTHAGSTAPTSWGKYF